MPRMLQRDLPPWWLWFGGPGLVCRSWDTEVETEAHVQFGLTYLTNWLDLTKTTVQYSTVRHGTVRCGTVDPSPSWPESTAHEAELTHSPFGLGEYLLSRDRGVYLNVRDWRLAAHITSRAGQQLITVREPSSRALAVRALGTGADVEFAFSPQSFKFSHFTQRLGNVDDENCEAYIPTTVHRVIK